VLARWRDWLQGRGMARAPPAADDWPAAFARVPVLAHWPAADRERLQQLALDFLADKALEPAAGTAIDRPQALAIALQAALPVLNLGLDWYAGWHAVVLYPDAFRSRFDEVDEAGVVHQVDDWRSGESWAAGPLILSLADAAAGGRGAGHNVVVHECAHKLDQRDGDCNGHPPLHAGMDPAAWKSVFADAYRHLGRRALRRLRTVLDPYAAESPAEFFAVASELFFDEPLNLRGGYPAVYEQLALFYRQDPAVHWAAQSVDEP
jgi:Mlc titration factor MtfA (ptsG expression regulator)